MVIDAHLHLWKIFNELSPPDRHAVLAGTATRFYALGTTSWTGR